MLAGQLPGLIAMSEAAEEKGLEKTVRFEETMKFLKMRVLSSELQHAVQEEADNVPEQEIDEYYKKNPEAYEQFSLERLFIPRFKQENTEKVNPEEKLSEEQQKAKDAADRAKQEQGEQEMTKLADTLRARAAAGEDFTKLQKEAFEAAGMKMDAPTVSLPTVRRTGLPPGHVAVFDLKVGEVSQVLSDNGGHYVYKVVSKQVLPLDQVKPEIHATLKMQRMKEMMDKYTNSYKAETNEAYLGRQRRWGREDGRCYLVRRTHSLRRTLRQRRIRSRNLRRNRHLPPSRIDGERKTCCRSYWHRGKPGIEAAPAAGRFLGNWGGRESAAD